MRRLVLIGNLKVTEEGLLRGGTIGLRAQNMNFLRDMLWISELRVLG